MDQPASVLSRVATWLTIASAFAVLFSIAASQILLALAFAALLASGDRVRLPRIKWALAAFIVGTLVSWVFSGEMGAGLPQIRKFYVFLQLVVTFSTLRDTASLRWLFLGWGALGAVISIDGLAQFATKLRAAAQSGSDPYTYYVAARITGFTSHWNTYGGELMLVFLMLCAYLLFAQRVRWHLLWWACVALVGVAILLTWTRGVWIAAAVAALYLLWMRKKWLVLLVPLAAALAFIVSPAAVKSRFVSIYKPKAVDSNEFRIVTWRTGLSMIEKHPLLGLGPQGVNRHFYDYVPADIRRPLPDGWYGHLHNVYLHYAAERGIPTMLALVLLLLQCIYDFWRGVRRLPPGRSDLRFLLHGAIAVVIAAMVEGVVELNLGDSEVLAMFLVVIGAGYVALDRASGSRSAGDALGGA
jgi:putative inorganic carbon (hco3(-)) transporter